MLDVDAAREVIALFNNTAVLRILCGIHRCNMSTNARQYNHKFCTQIITSAAGVVVSCKIPILATRVRFPGGASKLLFLVVLTMGDLESGVLSQTRTGD